MIPKIAIHGRKSQPNLTISFLKSLGGNNVFRHIGDDCVGHYWIDDINRIRCTNEIPIGYKFIDIWCEKYNELTETKYILVHWPESQYFIGMEGCYYIDSMGNINLDQAIFVPENIYNEIMK